MSFFTTQDDSDDEGFTFRADLDDLVGGDVIDYGDVMRFLNLARTAVGLARMIRSDARDYNLAQAADQANERAQREEERRRQAEEETTAARQETAAAQEETAAAREAAERSQAEVEAKQKELELINELHRLGIEPDHEVTGEEVRNARLHVGYVDGMTNIGVVGNQNDGKSTLVNCFRGVAHNDPESAMTGETEVTRSSAAYPDERHAGIVWHDISGGGTTYTKAWGYYYNQKLFAYDKLVLAHSSTLSETAVKILKICKYRSQECVVVRTKADEHIRNCKRRHNYSTVQEARQDFVGQVRRDTQAKNAEAGEIRELSPAYTDYIVCEMGITQLVSGREESSDPAEHIIDEKELLRRLSLIA